jgi:phospholipid/cholesterol/gamma-HCH transport system ATP-binding protein
LIVNLKDRFGMSLVVVTHELASIDAIADQVTMIDKGAVIAEGPLQTVKKMNHPMVRSFFDRAGEDVASKTSVLEALNAKQEG